MLLFYREVDLYNFAFTSSYCRLCILRCLPTAFEYQVHIILDDNETVVVSVVSFADHTLCRVTHVLLTNLIVISVPFSFRVELIQHFIGAVILMGLRKCGFNLVSTANYDEVLKLQDGSPYHNSAWPLKQKQDSHLWSSLGRIFYLLYS